MGVVSLAASPDGATVASSALDSQIRVWDARTHETRVIIACPPAENWHVAFVPNSPDTLLVAGGASKSVKLYDVSSDTEKAGTERGVLALPNTANETSETSSRFAQSVAVSDDGKLIACGASDGAVAVFDAVTSKFLHFL